MVAQIANAEAGSSVRSKLNTILAGDAARRVWGVKLSEASPFEAVWLTESELRDIIGIFGTDARGLVPTPGTPTGTRVLYDTGWAEASASIVDAVDDSTAYPTVSPYLVTSVFNQHRFFTNAANQFVQFPPGLSFDPAAHGRLTAPPNNTLSIRAAIGVTISGVAGDGSTTIWTVPAAGTVEWVVYANNTIEMYGDTTAELLLEGPLDAADQVLRRPELRDVAETVVAKGTLATGAISYDYSAGGYQWGTTGGGNITSVAITNPPGSGKAGALTLEFIQGATARTIAWGAAFRFPSGTDATLTAIVGAIDIFTLITRDGGATWYVFEGGKAFAA